MLQNVLIERPIYASEEHKMMQKMMQDFIVKEIQPQTEQWEKDGMVSREIWGRAGELGLLLMDMPEQYSGGGLDFSFNALFIEEMAKKGITGPGFLLQSDIIAPYLLHHGTEEQKQRYLPAMASGKLITAIGMTEANCGSDLKAIRTTAVDHGDHYVVNGQKTFITNGYMCDIAIIAAKTNKNTAQEGVTLLIVDANSEGFKKGRPYKKLGLKAQDTCELFFDDVKVPKENILGEEGKGFKMLMKELARERLAVAIGAVAGAEATVSETIEYTSSRFAFQMPLAGFQNTQFKLAECAAQVQIHQAFVDRCISLMAVNRLTTESASIAKFSASDMHCKVVDECLQIFGGYGYMWDYPVARAYADSRVEKIFAGTNEIMKLVIARGLFKELLDAMKSGM